MLTNIANEYREYLIQHPQLQEKLCQSRGLTPETLETFSIGYSAAKRRYSIPIRDSSKNTLNIRLYQNTNPKMISYDKGTGSARIFPLSALKACEDTLIICEGEWDCLMLHQHGFHAITPTGGAGTWKEEWNIEMLTYGITKVIIIFDCDDAGISGAKEVTKKLNKDFKQIKIVDLGLDDKGDISDWFQQGKTAEDLQALIDATEPFDGYKLVSLGDSLNAVHYDEKIKFYGIIMGKDLSPYIIPSRVYAKCKSSGTDKPICDICAVKNGPVERIFTYGENKDIFIRMLKANDMQLQGYLRQELKLPAGRKCPGSWEIKVLDRINVEEIIIVPELNNARIDETSYVQRTGYYFGYDIKTNEPHQFMGTTWSDPMNQMGIHLVEDAEMSKDDISKYYPDQEKLKLFQPKDQNNMASIQEKLDEICKDIFLNVTKMWKRENIIKAVDLVYHSVLSFHFMDSFVAKGWVECTIIGDTRCGKTETVKKMLEHYRAGEFITSGEHTTAAGLLGGLQQTRRGSWHVTWGKLVMNNRRLCVLDEADELSKNGILGLLSGVRSSGIAELVKIQSQRAQAKTRLIFITNPLWGKMSEKNFGIQVIREIFKAQQDMSRIDFVIGASEDDVSPELINQKITDTVPCVYTSDVCHESVMFAWSRKPDQVRFTPEAENQILHVSKRMGQDFSSDIPIVIGQEMRIKLARLCVALACRLYSVDPDSPEIVVVREAHVLTIANFLYTEYSSRVLGYKDLSDQMNRGKSIGSTACVDKYLVDIDTCNLLLDAGKIFKSDLEDIFSEQSSESKYTLSEMRKQRLLKRKGQFYVKTPGFIRYLKDRVERLKNQGIDQQFF